MSSSRPEFDIFPVEEFSTFAPANMESAPLSMCTLLRLGDNGKSLGIFQICLFGGGVCHLKFPASAVLPDCPPDLADIVLVLSLTARHASPALNSTTSPWRCLMELIKRKDILTQDSQGNIIPNRDLLEYLGSSASTCGPATCIGASIRWAVAATSDNLLQLELQCMPTQPRFLVKANLKNDNAVSVLIGVFPLEAEMLPGPFPCGPAPLLFAEDREAAYHAIQRDSDSLRDDIASLNNQFIRMEHLSLADAVQYLTAPRARAAKGSPAFPLPQGPPPKRTRPAADAHQTGSFLIYHYVSPCCSPLGYRRVKNC